MPDALWHEGGDEAANEETYQQVLPQHRPFHREIACYPRACLRRCKPAPPRSVRSVNLIFGLTVVAHIAGLLGNLFRIGQPHNQRHDRDEHEPAQPLGHHELPPHQKVENDAEFDHQIGRGEQERQRGGETCALAKQGPHDRSRCVGARGTRRTEQRGDADFPHARAAKMLLDGVGRYDSPDYGGNREAEHQRPPCFPGHAQGHQKRLPDVR